MNELLELVENEYPDALIVANEKEVIAFFHDGSNTELPERTEFWLEEEDGITWVWCKDYWQPGFVSTGSHRWCQL